MKTPNPLTIRPIDSASVAHLGEKIADHPNVNHRTTTPIIVGVSGVLLLIALVYMILMQGWSQWFWLLVPILGLFIWSEFERYPIKGLSIYENGLVLFHDLNNGLEIYSWTEIEVGITDWEDKTEYYIRGRDDQRGGACLDSNVLSGERRRINSALNEQPKSLLHQYWTERLDRGDVVEYENVELRREGLYFKKILTTLRWCEFDVWSANNENWEIVFRKNDGEIIEPKLFTYEVPYLAPLFEFAKQQKN